MKEKMKNPTEGVDNTNPYPIYPDIDRPIEPTVAHSTRVTEEEITQEVDTINPDPNSLDRG